MQKHDSGVDTRNEKRMRSGSLTGDGDGGSNFPICFGGNNGFLNGKESVWDLQRLKFGSM